MEKGQKLGGGAIYEGAREDAEFFNSVLSSHFPCNFLLYHHLYSSNLHLPLKKGGQLVSIPK